MYRTPESVHSSLIAATNCVGNESYNSMSLSASKTIWAAIEKNVFQDYNSDICTNKPVLYLTIDIIELETARVHALQKFCHRVDHVVIHGQFVKVNLILRESVVVVQDAVNFDFFILS